MSQSPLPSQSFAYSLPQRTLRRWVMERLQRSNADGVTVYRFALSGSTCSGKELEVVMTVEVGADGRIQAASARPAENDRGCDAMCIAQGDRSEWSTAVGECKEALGLTLDEAAGRAWQEEPSGCFCTIGHRRHKWRNCFQVLHFAAADAGRQLVDTV